MVDVHCLYCSMYDDEMVADGHELLMQMLDWMQDDMWFDDALPC